MSVSTARSSSTHELAPPGSRPRGGDGGFRRQSRGWLPPQLVSGVQSNGNTLALLSAETQLLSRKACLPREAQHTAEVLRGHWPEAHENIHAVSRPTFSELHMQPPLGERQTLSILLCNSALSPGWAQNSVHSTQCFNSFTEIRWAHNQPHTCTNTAGELGRVFAPVKLSHSGIIHSTVTHHGGWSPQELGDQREVRR